MDVVYIAVLVACFAGFVGLVSAIGRLVAGVGRSVVGVSPAGESDRGKERAP
ncbi:MAG: hypothetical protein L6Q99_22335 [Planctomycetes bacterium]|nr:hypothetical protein [Planctomycetota bacterium]